MVVSTVPMTGAALALSPIVAAIQAAYGVASAVNDWLDKHIEDMKSSDNPTVSRAGRVIEMAKYGFGIGYITPVVVIAVGQMLLGNPLGAAATVATAATLTNPAAMTCAAIGAIYFGWSALSDTERTEILDKLTRGLQIGAELIIAIVAYVTKHFAEVMNSKNLKEIREYIATTASAFGKTLGDITHKLGDIIGSAVDVVKKKSTVAISTTKESAAGTYELLRDKTSAAIDATVETASETYEKIRKTSTRKTPAKPQAINEPAPQPAIQPAPKTRKKAASPKASSKVAAAPKAAPSAPKSATPKRRKKTLATT
ncbi:MAG: hypothetical protein FIB06_05530 [Betaproteobacteria bacterium]|nr:hypothetical protein [Betaproteobacteria bacterium]